MNRVRYPHLTKTSVARAAASLVLALSLSISIADLFIPLFWERRLMVRLGFVVLATVALAVLVLKGLSEIPRPPVATVPRGRRFLRLLFAALLAGSMVVVFAGAARHPLQPAPARDTHGRPALDNGEVDRLTATNRLAEGLLLSVSVVFLAAAVWHREYRSTGSQQRAWRGAALVLALLVFLCYASSALRRGGQGFNYQLYGYFSGLSWQGQNPYLAPPVTTTDRGESYRQPDYLDYSGAQLLIYNVCYYVTTHLGVDGFILYSLLLLLLSLALAYQLAVSEVLSWQESLLFTVLLLSPYLWYTLLFDSYEDKALYILLPLAVLYSRSKSLKATGLLLGLASGLSGIAAAVFPLVAISIAKDPEQARPAKYRSLLIVTAGLLVAGALAFLPFFPESLIGWQRRAILESNNPYWFSLWNLAGPLYITNLNKAVILLACLSMYGLFAAGYLEFKTAMILVLSFFFTFSVTMSPQRILPFVIVLVLVFRHSLPRLAYFAAAFGLLGAFQYLDQARSFFRIYPASLAIAQAKSLIMMSPILLGYGLVVLDNLRPLRPRGTASGAGQFEPAVDRPSAPARLHLSTNI